MNTTPEGADAGGEPGDAEQFKIPEAVIQSLSMPTGSESDLREVRDLFVNHFSRSSTGNDTVPAQPPSVVVDSDRIL